MRRHVSEDTAAVLDIVADILLRCFLITLAAMLFTWGVYLTAGDFISGIQARLYEISKPEFDLYFLYTMTIMKILNLLFFLFPCIAIKTYLRGTR